MVSAASVALGVKSAMEASNAGNNVKPAVVMTTNGGTHRKSPIGAMMDGGGIGQQQQQQQHGLMMGGAPRIANGNILKTALTNPSEVLHLRRRLESAVTSSRDSMTSMPYETAMSAICTLIYCDEFEDIATLKVILIVVDKVDNEIE